MAYGKGKLNAGLLKFLMEKRKKKMEKGKGKGKGKKENFSTKPVKDKGKKM